MSFAEINNLHISFGENKIIENFNLSINPGEIYSIIGPSGCGKSTLLKAICGIIKPTEGNIFLNSKPADTRRDNIGYIPQHYGLLDWLKVKKNIAIGEKLKQIKSSNKLEIIQKLGIEDLLERYPSSLSGGQKQRVALARAWILQPALMLMDEPFSALDTFTADVSKELFIKLWKEQKTTTLFVTHNIQEAVEMGKHIVILSEKPARVIRIIENPLLKKGASRTEDDYFYLAKEIRGILQKEWRNIP